MCHRLTRLGNPGSWADPPTSLKKEFEAAVPLELTRPPSSNLVRREILHVDEAAWSRHLRVAPSRTSPGSAVKSRDPSFEETAPRDRPPRREFIPPPHAGSWKDGFTRRLLTTACSRFQLIGVRQAPQSSPPPTCWG